MMVIPVMVTVTPRELETIGTLTIWNSGEERVDTPFDGDCPKCGSVPGQYDETCWQCNPTPNGRVLLKAWVNAPILTRYEIVWSDEHGTIKDDVWHNRDDGAMPLLAKATEKLKRGPKV
jgi:hypothetical protein